MKFISEIIDNRILSEIVKDGEYQIEIKKPRNLKFHKKYWKLLEFTVFHLPESFMYTVSIGSIVIAYINITDSETLHSLFKYMLGVESISFANMDDTEFSDFYSRSLDICCQLLSTEKETVIRELSNFF